MVTPQTSLLVLDTLEQHLQHDVEPARSRVEMHALWIERKQERRADHAAKRAEHLRTLIGWWERKKDWYAKDVDGAGVMANAKKKYPRSEPSGSFDRFVLHAALT